MTSEPAPAAPPAAADALIVARVGGDLARLLAAPLEPGLHLVATPIGNLGDLSLRAIATLARADVVYCEDTRRSRPLLQHFGISRPLRTYHDHNGQRERPVILAELAAGRRVALISDAGTPLISDPGYKLVREALAADRRVSVVPGASAVTAGLALAGLPTDCFLFLGFLPPRTAARRARLAAAAGIDATLVVFETAQRLADTLADAANVLGDRPAAIARELTKLHEEVLRGSLPALAAATLPTLGEVVVLIGPPPPGEVSDAAILDRLAACRPALSVRDAAREVAEALDVPRSRVYALSIKTRT